MLSQTSFYRKLSVITSTYLLLMYCVLRVRVCVCVQFCLYILALTEGGPTALRGPKTLNP